VEAGPKRQSGWKTARHADSLSQGFIRDFALVWAEEGLEAVRKVAKKSPATFVAIAARICPNDVRLTLEQAIPGGMSLEDYSLMREVIAAIREGLPDADQMQPGAVFSMCSGPWATVPRKTEKRTVLFASAKFANDLKADFTTAWRSHSQSITRQAEALNISRGSVYYLPRAFHDVI
jgi:hypothetical protein